jgi:hypothetical protein
MSNQLENKSMIFMMLSNQLAKYFGNELYSPMIYIFLSNFNFDIHLENLCYLMIPITSVIIGFGIYKLYQYYEKIKYYELKIIDTVHIRNFIKYMKTNNYLENITQHTKGDLLDMLNLKLETNIRLSYGESTDDNIKIYFHDKKHNVKGYYYFLTETLEKNIIKNKDCSENIKVSHKYIIVKLSKNIPLLQYYESIETEMENYRKNTLELFYCKIISTKTKNIKNNLFTLENHNVQIYKGDIIKEQSYYDKFFNDFFHNEKKYIMERIYKLKKNPDNRISLILHGPPGSGKTSFAYRIAKYFNRNIISFEFNKMTKVELYQIFDSPSIDDSPKSYTDCVYVFDEFDKAFFDIYERELLTKKLMENTIEKLSKPIKEDTNNEVSNYIDDSVKLSDLLELFQGVIPRNGSIVIATTNHFDKINEICPALFRPGRLTPIHFDYFNESTFQEFCNYFYNKNYPFEVPKKLNISPSELIELSDYYDFNTFVEIIQKKIR